MTALLVGPFSRTILLTDLCTNLPIVTSLVSSLSSHNARFLTENTRPSFWDSPAQERSEFARGSPRRKFFQLAVFPAGTLRRSIVTCKKLGLTSTPPFAGPYSVPSV